MREMDKVIGYEAIKTELYRIVDIIRNPEKYKKLGVKAPKGILLEGDPGIGKTLLAQSFIKDTSLKYYVVRKDRPNGEFVDHIRETFNKAVEESPAIVLLDDLDKFANEDKTHQDAEEYVAVQACIDNVKELDVFVIATSNDHRKLPPSLVRSGRFDKCFFMRFPGLEDAKKIIEYYLKDKKVAKDVDVEEIARILEDHSCADLEAVINEAGIYAGYENRKSISQDDIKKAVVSKIFNGCVSEHSDPISDRRLAVHEAGHAVLSELFYPGQVAFISIEARAYGIKGIVRLNDDENCSEDFQNNEIDIMIRLAGKAATEIILNEIDMGAVCDLRCANDKMIQLLECDAAFDFYSQENRDKTSKKVYDHLDTVKGAELTRYYIKTKQLLGKNRAFLEDLIETVLEKRTLTYKDIAPIREKYKFNFIVV